MEIHRALSEQSEAWGEIRDALEEAGFDLPEAVQSSSEAKLLFADWADKAACVCAEVYTAIMRLEPEQSLIMTLRYIEGQPWAEVARRCGISERSVNRIHSAALEELDMVRATRRPPNLRYMSDHMFTFASSSNVVGGDTTGRGAVLSPDPTDVFAD